MAHAVRKHLFLKLVPQSRRFASTIFALASALKDKGSPIAVVRVSGEDAAAALNKLTLGKGSEITKKPRTCIVSQLFDPKSQELVDKSVVAWFPGPKSYTGEDMCELHVHGSKAVISLLLKTLGEMKGLRPAEPGEFTRRAFVNGKIDLTEAEGIGDLIAAQTQSQRKRAVNAMSGRVTQLHQKWREQLMQSMAHLEANIDFGEDELLDEQLIGAAMQKVEDLKKEVYTYLQETSRKSELIKHGLEIAIIGEPNVGKSSLINQLCQRDLSIVSPVSGTTRDVVEGLLDINGYAVRICDTAGLKDLQLPLQDAVEEEGIRRAVKRAQAADLIIFVANGPAIVRKDMHLEKLAFEYKSRFNYSPKSIIYVVNKIDLLNEKEKIDILKRRGSQECSLMSCKTQEGLEDFLSLLSLKVRDMCGDPLQEEGLFVSERHRSHLLQMNNCIESALKLSRTDLSICAHYLKEAVKEVSYITGKITTDDILDIIFKDFCIGK